MGRPATGNIERDANDNPIAVRLTVNGEPRRIKLPVGCSEKEALSARDLFALQASVGIMPGKPESEQIGRYAKRWASGKYNGSLVKGAVDFFGPTRPITSITPEDATAYSKHLEEKVRLYLCNEDGGISWATACKIVPAVGRMLYQIHNENPGTKDASEWLVRPKRFFRTAEGVPIGRVVASKNRTDWPCHGGVYFIQLEHGDRPIKIGRATNIRGRIADIDGSLPARVTLLAVIEGNGHQERAIHKKMHDWRMNGEWFVASPIVLAFIDRVVAHGYDDAIGHSWETGFCSADASLAHHPEVVARREQKRAEIDAANLLYWSKKDREDAEIDRFKQDFAAAE